MGTTKNEIKRRLKEARKRNRELEEKGESKPLTKEWSLDSLKSLQKALGRKSIQ